MERPISFHKGSIPPGLHNAYSITLYPRRMQCPATPTCDASPRSPRVGYIALPFFFISPHKIQLSVPPYKTCRVQNPDIPRAGRGGAAHGGEAFNGAGAGRGAADEEGTVELLFADGFAQKNRENEQKITQYLFS